MPNAVAGLPSAKGGLPTAAQPMENGSATTLSAATASTKRDASVAPKQEPNAAVKREAAAASRRPGLEAEGMSRQSIDGNTKVIKAEPGVQEGGVGPGAALVCCP